MSTSLVSELSWDEVELRLGAGAPAILPVGAGAKQHGWHLPMGTDRVQADWLSAQLAARVGGLVWPTVGYGYYPAFVDYTGSCSLSAATFEAVMRELIEALLAYRARAVLVVDTGISTIAPVDRALAAVREPGRVLHLRVYDGPLFKAEVARLARQAHGGHADEIETSILLALAPDLARMERAAASSRTPPGPGPMQRARPDKPNYSASGSIGDPKAATAATGKALLAAMVADIEATIAAWPALYEEGAP